MDTARVYNMILIDKTFKEKHCFALLGLEKSTNCWTLLGGKIDPTNSFEENAARHLYIKSGMLLKHHCKDLKSYTFGAHKVFIHTPGNMIFSVEELNINIKKIIKNKQLSDEYKEISRFQIIKVTDLMTLAKQSIKGHSAAYIHAKEPKPMIIDGWLLYTLKHSTEEMLNYNY